MDEHYYTEKEINYLKENYPTKRKKEIMENVNRSWSSIQKKCFKFGIKRVFSETKINGKVEKLLDDSAITYYWIGFMMADGHFSSRQCNIQINLSIKDIEHLIKLAKYLEINDEFIKPRLTISNKRVISELIEKFNISNNKTYFPCDLSGIVNEDLLFSLIIGFIDGDGHIDKQSIRVKCHKSWFSNLEKMLNYLLVGYEKSYKVTLIKDNLAYFSISDIVILKKIKERVLELGLPVLDRKWVNISFDKLSKSEKSDKYKKNCFKFFKEGNSLKEVKTITGYSSSFVYDSYIKYCYENNIKYLKIKDKKDIVYKLLSDGCKSVNEISKISGFAKCTIHRIIRKERDLDREMRKNLESN